ncbi:MAG TPA: hypothetical protein VLL25_12140, partial [Acidimicrobiales bacterium]|nr:hypothetical protein [Acidimicrobiales bacterium]
RAIGAGWLTVTAPATKRYPARYRLGDNFREMPQTPRGAVSDIAAYRGTAVSQTSRSRRETRDRRSDVDTKSDVRAARLPRGGGDGLTSEQTERQSDGGPAPAEPVEKPHEIVAAAQEYLRSIPLRNPHHPDHVEEES